MKTKKKANQVNKFKEIIEEDFPEVAVGMTTEDLQDINAILDFYLWDIGTFLEGERLKKAKDTVKRLRRVFTDEWDLVG